MTISPATAEPINVGNRYSHRSGRRKAGSSFPVSSAVCWVIFSWVAGLFISLISTAAASYCAIAIFICTALVTYLARPQLAAATLPILGVRALELVAAPTIGAGMFIDEVMQIGHASLAFLWLAILYSQWMLLQLILWKRENSDLIGAKSRLSPIIAEIALIICGLCIVYSLTIFAIHGFPLVQAKNRFDYGLTVSDPIFRFVWRYRLPWMFLLGAMFGWGYRPVVSASLAAAMLVVAVLGADKLSSPIAMLTSFASCYLLAHGRFRLLSPVPIALVLGVALALGGYVFEMSQGGRSSGIGKVSFFRRLPAQASLWHVVNEKGPPVLNLDGAQVGREIYNVATLNKERFVPPYTGGFYMLMKYTSVQTRIVHIIQNSGLIMVLYPYLLDQYGWIAILIFNVVFALYNLFAITQLRDAISRRSVPMVFASGTLIFFQVGTIWGGDLNMMAGPVALACVAVLVFAKLRISALAESARAMKSVAETSARSG